MSTFAPQQANRAVYRLQSPWKLARGVAMICIALGLALVGLSSATAGSDPVLLEKVVVSQGDTIWGLAEQYAQDGNLESWIVEFANLNNLVSSSLEPGQTLLLPAE